MLDELRGPLESEVELLIGVKYWLIPVLKSGVSVSGCVGREGFCVYCINSCSGSGMTKGASRFGEGKRGG